jgi:acetyltransferase-like isoleucine patch superfamily enzyme
VYVDFGVVIGSNVKIQNGVSVYHGVKIEDGVFVGPHVCFTNDKYPRAVNPDGTLKGGADWQVSGILIQEGAALGARSVVLPGVTVGKWAMVAAGAVVTRDVPDYGLMVGHPARIKGFVCPCGRRLEPVGTEGESVHTRCSECETQIDVSLSDWQQIA